jgi:Zn finger protein HypA/HybF involved in hydrogenase expression
MEFGLYPREILGNTRGFSSVHEFALMQSIVTAILERLAQEPAYGRVTEVILEVGILELHSEAAGRRAFELLTRGTPLENSRLTLKIRPVLLECPECHVVTPFELEDHVQVDSLMPPVTCPVCGTWARLTGGQGVGPIEIVFGVSGATS